MSIFESIRVGGALSQGKEGPIGVREAFKETCSEFTSNAEPKFTLEKDHMKIVKEGYDGWIEAFYQYNSGEQLKNYQRSLTLHDGNEYIIQSYRSCRDGTCEDSLALYLNGERIADALEGEGLKQVCGTPQALGLLTEGLRVALGYKREIEPLRSFERVACVIKVKPPDPCAVYTEKIALGKLNDYIRKGNFAARHYTKGVCNMAVGVAYKEAFPQFLGLQDEVIKAMPECAHNGEVLISQGRATEVLNELKQKFKIKCESYADFYTDEGFFGHTVISIVGIVAVCLGSAPLGLGIYGVGQLITAARKIDADIDVPEYNP